MNDMQTFLCCKDCTERHMNCHAECEKYKEAKETNERIKAERKKKLQESQFIIDCQSKIRKITRKKKKMKGG